MKKLYELTIKAIVLADDELDAEHTKIDPSAADTEVIEVNNVDESWLDILPFCDDPRVEEKTCREILNQGSNKV